MKVKKTLMIILGIMISITIMVGCTDEENGKVEKENGQIEEENDKGEEENGTEETRITAQEKVAVEEYSLLGIYDIDINQDEKEESIALYTAAETDQDGEIIWDDGQNWSLIVHGQDEDHVLFDQYVQIGSIQFYVFTVDDMFHIVTTQNTTAGLKVVEYVFDKDNNDFTQKTRYEASGNVNMLHVSKNRF